MSADANIDVYITKTKVPRNYRNFFMTQKPTNIFVRVEVLPRVNRNDETQAKNSEVLEANI